LKQYYLFLVFIFFNSCQYFDKQIPSEKELLQKELKSINWKEVDEYPSVVDCEKIDNKAQRQQCFFEVLTQLIQEKLSVDTLSILYPELDTIEVKVTVFPNATLQFEPQFPKDSLPLIFQLFTVSFSLKKKKKDAVSIWARVLVHIRIFCLSIRIFQTKNTKPRSH
jgi:hypothetical protein